MFQLNIPNLEEDILASSLRRHQNLMEELIQDLKWREITPGDASNRIRKIEKELRHMRSNA